MQDSDVKDVKMTRIISRQPGENCDFCFYNRTGRNPDPLQVECICATADVKCRDQWCNFTSRPKYERGPYVKRS